MKFIQCVTDTPYIIWQLYVQMLNFRDFGYEKEAVVIVNTCSPSRLMLAFQNWTKASIFYYADTRQRSNYFSSFRPNVIKQYLADHPTDCFFYHDQDIIFRRKVDLDSLQAGRSHYIASEASSYLRISYLQTFEKYNHLEDMCAIVGISPEVVQVYDRLGAVGGAQYVIKGTGYEFWDKIERDCEAIYTRLKSDVQEDSDNHVHHIQVWTSDMWALLYNLYLTGSGIQISRVVEFAWPWDSKDHPAPILHNAGIDESNQRLKDTGIQAYFHKNKYVADTPFEQDHSYVLPGIVQQEYIAYFRRAFAAMGPLVKIRRVLGVFCTHNRINPDLLSTVLDRLKIARDNARLCEVQIITCSWEKIPDNPFHGLISPFRDLGHLNYLLQIRQVLATARHNDIVCILEHDMLYPDNYFDHVVENWSEGKYGVYNLNYIGVNDTGYLKVRQRDSPMSLCSAARFYMDRHITRKIDEALDKLSSANTSALCVEPPVGDFKMIEYSGDKPCIHVNMNGRGQWGSGREGKNHHFTNHCEVCYEQDSNGNTHDAYWGHYKELIPA